MKKNGKFHKGTVNVLYESNIIRYVDEQPLAI